MWLCARRLQNTVTPTCHYCFFSRPPTRLRPTEQVTGLLSFLVCLWYVFETLYFGLFFWCFDPKYGSIMLNIVSSLIISEGRRILQFSGAWRSCLCTSPLASTRHGRLSRLHEGPMDTYGVSQNLENYEAPKLVKSVICSEPAQVCSKGLSLSMRNPAQSTAAHLSNKCFSMRCSLFTAGCVAAHFDHNGLKMCVVNAHLEARGKICHKACRNQNVEVQ